MEQLTAIVFDDNERGIIVGYKDLAEDEFWTRGHMPGMPLMPGIVMCEAAAQLCTYHVQKHDLLGAEMLGFGGLDQCSLPRHGNTRRPVGNPFAKAASPPRSNDPQPFPMPRR